MARPGGGGSGNRAKKGLLTRWWPGREGSGLIGMVGKGTLLMFRGGNFYLSIWNSQFKMFHNTSLWVTSCTHWIPMFSFFLDWLSCGRNTLITLFTRVPQELETCLSAGSWAMFAVKQLDVCPLVIVSANIFGFQMFFPLSTHAFSFFRMHTIVFLK